MMMLVSRDVEPGRVRVGEKRDAVYAYGWSYDQTTHAIVESILEEEGKLEVDPMRMTLIHLCPAVEGEDRRPAALCFTQRNSQ